MSKKYRYSEMFMSMQGEGHYTGVPTVWYRTWGCNFNCMGFGQEKPRDPTTWIHEYEHVDLTQVKTMEELPVFKYGCDSSYSWAKRFGHLAHADTAEDIAKKLTTLMTNEYNPTGSFIHPYSKQSTHLAFTGGETMMSQTALVDIMGALNDMNNIPTHITIETNGTQALRKPFESTFGYWVDYGNELFWSISPKLGTSGEDFDHAILPHVVKEYYHLSQTGQLKFVLDRDPETWDELRRAVDEYRDAGIDFPVWIMPVGGTREEQEEVQAEITEKAIAMGFNTAIRVHAFVWSNIIGK